MAIISEIDLSVPLSKLLRSGTAKAHESAENSKGAGWLARAELDRDEYVRFLMMMWHVYDTLERSLDRHASYPTLEPTYNPSLLARAPSISADIASFLDISESSWQTHPIHVSLLSNPPIPFTEYTSRLKIIADSPDPSPLLAHAYVRYMGDLNGGQVIKRRIAKAYGFDLEGGAGVEFYEFRELGGTKYGSLRDIMTWYRDGMNAGVGENEDIKGVLLEEAIKAFELNSNLFSILKPPKSHLTLSSVAAPPPLGIPIPTSPIDTPTREIPVEVLHSSEPTENAWPLASVLTVVVAVCLGHFLLVINGFTGAKGYQAQWDAFERWIDRIFQNNAQ